MTILYNKQGIGVDVPEGAVDDALKNGFTRDFASLSVLVKNYNPDVNQNDIPVDIQGSLKQVEFILNNRSDSAINVRYGEVGSETIIPGGVPARGRLRLLAFSGITQVAELPTANLSSSDSDNFVELGTAVIFTATQVVAGTISKVEFYVGAKLIGTSTTVPYTTTNIFNATGTYRVYARVYSGTEYTTTNSIQVFAIPNKRQDRNLLPVVSLTAPTTGIINQAITLNSTATDPDGTVNKVEFYVNNTKIGEDLTSPYSISFTPIANNIYALRARAIDNLGGFSDSNVVTFVVAAPVPVVSVTAPSTANTNASVNLTATASITGDTIDNVLFRANGVNIGSADTSSPYGVTWTVPTTPGTYSITATATGTQGGTATSAAASVVVSTPVVPIPTVSIASTTPKAGVINEAITVNATAAITGDTLSGVQFRADGTSIGSADTSSPYSVSYTATTKGVKQLSAIATGSQGGSATSSNYAFTAYDTKILGGASGAGTSLGAVGADFILFDNNQAAGGNAATMNIFVNGEQVAAFNYGDTAYNGRSFAYFNSANSVMYTGTIAATVNLS